MALNKIEGNTQAADGQAQRIAAGTVARDHVQQSAITAAKTTNVIDDTSSDITYNQLGGTFGTTSLDFFTNRQYSYGGTFTVLGGLILASGTPGVYAEYRFKGNSIGVLGCINDQSGAIEVYIDGVRHAGRTPFSTTLKRVNADNSAAVKPGDTTIQVLANTFYSATGGRIMLGNEIITYTSATPTSFDGVTVTQTHYLDETVYKWSSYIDCYSTLEHTSRQLIYYNPFLEDKEHIIRIQTATSNVSSIARFFFDGFVTGSLIGSKNIASRIGTLNFTSVLTDANGHAELGELTAFSNDVSIIGMLGYSQLDCESSNTNIAAKLLVKYAPDGQPFFYVHNGPVNTTINIRLIVTYISESI